MNKQNNYNQQYNGQYNQQNNNQTPINFQSQEKRYLQINGESTLFDEKVVNQYFAKDAKITDQEAKFLFELCKAKNLNPFIGEAHIVKYSSYKPAQIITDYKVVQDRILSDPDFNGLESGIIIERNGELINMIGGVKATNDIIVGGWAKVYRKNVEVPLTTTVSLEEFAGRTKDGKLNSQWAGKTAFMIEKVAKTHAFRASFPKNIQGMYIDEEMQHSRNEVSNNNNKKINKPKSNSQSQNPLNKKREDINNLCLEIFKITGENKKRLFNMFGITGKENYEQLEEIEGKIIGYLCDVQMMNDIQEQ